VNLDAVVHANALNIDQHTAPESFDVVLCLGPLYHLHESQQRIAVIDNAIQVTKQGGYIILAYVTIFAHLRDMARRQPSRLFNEWDFYKVYLTNGEYTRRSDNVSFHAYPKMIEKELQPFERQVHVERVVSCEGFAGFHGGKYLANLDENEMKCWVDVILMSAEDKETCNSADHLLVILRKQ
jgi:S-adenosylmethionine-dependent methyltransferase